MNIPMIIKPGHNHPTMNENVFKGTEYQYQKKLFFSLQETCQDTQLKFMEKIQEIKADITSFENDIITRTLAMITVDEQRAGKLVQCLPEDAQCFNDISSPIFNLIHNIC